MKASNSIRKGLWLLPSLLLLVVIGSYNNCSQKGFTVDSGTAKKLGIFGENDNLIIGNNAGTVDVKINERPPLTTDVNNVNNTQFVVNFDVVPKEGATVKEVKCFLDGKEIACTPGTDVVIPPSNQTPGYHVLTVQVVDNNNNPTIVPITYGIFNGTTNPCKDVIVGESKMPSVDIVIVVDNSQSMQDSQKNMAQRVGSFMDKFKGLINYRIGIITTDGLGVAYKAANSSSYDLRPELGRGSLLKLPNGAYFLDSSMDLATAQSYLSQTIQRPEIGNGAETGLTTIKQLVQRSKGTLGALSNYPQFASNEATANTNAKAFLRADAALIAIVISDEDETPHPSDANAASASITTPQGLIDGIKSLYPDKYLELSGIIIAPGDSVCLKEQQADNAYSRFGSSYMTVAQITGGKIGNICADDYGAQLSQLGSQLAAIGKRIFALNSFAADKDGDGKADVVIKDLNGNLIATKYIVNGDKIEFETAIEAGKQYNVEYYCAQ